MPNDTNPRARRKTITILGGGLGGLAAAYALTNEPGWRERYRVEVLQKGWRLGGKGASGRGPNGRIQEHGLHCFWGFYDNAFRMLRTCYSELARASGPLRSVDDAFKKLDAVYFIDRVGDRWCRYEMRFPETDERPGSGPSLTEMSVAGLVERFLGQVRAVLSEHGDVAAAFEASIATELESHLEAVVALVRRVAIGAGTGGDHIAAHDALAKLTAAPSVPSPDGAADPDQAYRRHILFAAAKLAFFVVKGLVVDGVPTSLDDFAKLDDMDLRAWLAKHGAGPELLASPVVRGLYDASFCYVAGDFAKPNLAAGVSLRTLLLMGFTYKGAFMWKMQASMGDVVFAPLYQALLRRGVSFRFFHKVTRLSLDAAKRGVERIDVDVQADVVGAAYDPLVDVRGLPCWPASPRYELLRDADRLRGHDLESDWASAAPARRLTLQRGTDFDAVVLAIPIAALRTPCVELADASAAWRGMLDNVKTIRTKSFQVWLEPTPEQAAWQGAHRIMTDVFEDDFNSAADMFQTLPFEDWPPGTTPGGVMYFSTAMADDPAEPPPGPNDAYQTTQDLVVDEQARAWLARWQEGIFGWLGPTFRPDAFADWYARANASADQRYTLSVATSTRHRLRPDGSGFDALFLAGDWTKSPLDLGCAENATMSGLLAARAVLERFATPEDTGPSAFVEAPGMPVYAPPYHQTGITLCQFVLRADARRLQAVIDRYLDGGEGRFRALGRWVVLQTGHIAENTSGPPDDAFGTGRETSATFLVPCVRWRGRGPHGAAPVEVGFFAPYVFVDHPLSVIAGREVLGMTKHLATFDGRMPEALDDTTVSTMAVRRLGATSPVTLLPLLRLGRADAGRPAAPGAADLGRAIERAAATVAERGAAPVVRALLERLLRDREVRLFSLRQLRRTDAPGRAAFREVTVGRMRLHAVALKPMGGTHTIEIEPLESHPVAEMLGLGANPLRPVAKVRLEIDRATLDVGP